MGNIKFGRSQLKNPTPANWAGFVKVFSVIAGIVIGWVGTQPFIPVETGTVIQSVLGLLLAIANGILPFFGVEVQGKTVNADDVTEMETPEQNKKNVE
jgi:hypothetical protein